MARRSTIERIASEFAQAVTEGDLTRAEGWAAVAFLHEGSRIAGRRFRAGSSARARPSGPGLRRR